jgi:hypothetical protein
MFMGNMAVCFLANRKKELARNAPFPVTTVVLIGIHRSRLLFFALAKLR